MGWAPFLPHPLKIPKCHQKREFLPKISLFDSPYQIRFAYKNLLRARAQSSHLYFGFYPLLLALWAELGWVVWIKHIDAFLSHHFVF